MINYKLNVFTGIFFALLPFSHVAVADDMSVLNLTACDESTLERLFFTPSPGYREVVDSINDLYASADLKCGEAIKNSSVLQKYLTEGDTFRSQYLAKYQTYFVAPSERNLVLFPEIEARLSLYAEMERGKRNRVETQPSEIEIHQRALSETLTRYGLPPTLSQSAFERIARSEARYFAALNDMNRLEYRLRETWRTPRKILQRSPEAFKAKMIDRINQARSANLQASIRESLVEWAGHGLQFTDKQTQRQVSLRIEDLATSTVQFLNGDTTASGADRILSDAPKRRRRGFGTWFVTEFFNETPAFYTGQVVQQNQHDEVVQITTPHGEVLLISGEDYTAVLNSLAPKSLSDHFVRDSVVHRFRVEATARDAQLANLTTFLKSRPDQSFEELSARIYERIASQKFDQNLASPFLTYEINSAGPKIMSLAAVSDVVWFGWAKLPQYWKVRDERAKLIGAPSLGQSDVSTSVRKSTNKSELRRSSWRYLTEQERTKKVVKKSRPAMAGALMLASWMFGFVPSPTAIIHQYFPSVANQLGIGSDLENDSMDENAEASNYEIPGADQKGKGGGPRKTPTSAHDPESSDYRIEIIAAGDGVPVPKYFNTAKLYQIPDDDPAATPMILNQPLRRDEDLTIDGNYNIREAPDRRLGLVQMTNFKLEHIDLYDYQNKLVPDSSYFIYEVKANHANYIHLRYDATARGPFTFRASYSYRPDLYRAESLAKGLPSSAISQVVQRMNSSGFKELSTKLVQQLPRTPMVSYKDLAYDFSADATYTNHGKTWLTNFLADTRFREFTKFLNPDGELFYQCTGSNLLFGRFVDEINATANHRDVQFIPLIGFVNDSGNGSRRGSPGHLHTLVVNHSDSGYLELDATPTKQDQKNIASPSNATAESKATATQPAQPDPPNLPAPAKPVPHEKQINVIQPWIRPEGNQLPKLTGQAEPFPTPVEPSVVIKRLPHDLAEIERILRRVTQMRDIAVKDLSGALDNAAFKNQHFADLPGVRLVVLSKILLRGFEEAQTPEHLLHALQDPKHILHGKPRPIDRDHARAQLNQYFADELNSYRRTMAQLDLDTREGKNSAFEFLTYDPIRSHLRELVEVLSVYSWGDLLERYHALPKCKDALSAH